MNGVNAETRVRAYAKINLFLDVIGQRADGYHLVNMAMQSLALCDTLYFCVRRERADKEAKDRLRIKDASGAGRFASLETGAHNLVLRAVDALRERCVGNFPADVGFDILLTKEIPVEAGLAGGSADAAAALLAVNDLLALGLSGEALAETALSLGADVPYCLRGGTVRAEGIGERLTPLPPMPPCAVVLAKPAGSASTKAIYQALDGQTERTHPSWEQFSRALAVGDPGRIAGRLGNVLEPVTALMIPEIARINAMMKSAGALGAQMTGSGSVVFGLFADEAAAGKAAEKLRGEKMVQELFVTRPITAEDIARERFL